VRPGTDPTSVSAALRAAAAGYPVKVSPSDSYLDSVRSSQYKEDRQAITVLLGIALAYSLVAVVSTMVIAASGRKREIASLSLAGSTRRQSLWFIAAEAIVAVLAGVIVAGAGATTVVIGQRAALTRLSADVPVSIPLVAIGEVIGVCLAVAVLTSMLSGWRVLRGRVVELAGLRE
jgi:putative ABC transport system permease protein